LEEGETANDGQKAQDKWICKIVGQRNPNLGLLKKDQEERYSRVPRLSDTRYSAKGTKVKWRCASSKARLKCATYRR